MQLDEGMPRPVTALDSQRIEIVRAGRTPPALDERAIEAEGSAASRAATIARALAEDRHRTIAFLSAYLAFQPVIRADVSPVVAQLVRLRNTPHLAPPHLRRLATVVHVAWAIASQTPLNEASMAAAGFGHVVRGWVQIANRL